MFSFIHVFQRPQIKSEITLAELARRQMAASWVNRAKLRGMKTFHRKYK